MLLDRYYHPSDIFRSFISLATLEGLVPQLLHLLALPDDVGHGLGRAKLVPQGNPGRHLSWPLSADVMDPLMIGDVPSVESCLQNVHVLNPREDVVGILALLRDCNMEDVTRAIGFCGVFVNQVGQTPGQKMFLKHWDYDLPKQV